MFRFRRAHSVATAALFTVLAAVLPSGSAPGHSLTYDNAHGPCARPIRVPIHSTARGPGIETGAVRAYVVETSERGILTVDASVPGPGPAEPRLAPLTHGCQQTAARRPGVTYLYQSATNLVLEVPGPGRYVFGVAAQDDLLALGEHKLRVDFVGLDNARITKAVAAVKEGEEEPPPPDPSAGGSETGDPLLNLCHQGEVDDHGDTLLCATAVTLGANLAASSRNDRGDDYDFFTFSLATVETVRAETKGDLDTFGGLYDANGHRLIADNNAGEGSNFRLVKTLTPGRYFVRVEGHGGAEGAYSLIIKQSDWKQ